MMGLFLGSNGMDVLMSFFWYIYSILDSVALLLRGVWMPKFTKHKDYNKLLRKLEVLEGLFALSGWFCNATCS